jgi:hypothetical protein
VCSLHGELGLSLFSSVPASNTRIIPHNKSHKFHISIHAVFFFGGGGECGVVCWFHVDQSNFLLHFFKIIFTNNLDLLVNDSPI